MKPVLIIILFVTLIFPLIDGFLSPCFAELTKEDVRQIIRAEIEPVRKEVEFIKIDIAEIKSDIKLLEGRMASLERKMAMVEGKMATKDDIIAVRETLGGQMSILYGILISIPIAIIVAILGIFLAPSLRKWSQERKQSR